MQRPTPTEEYAVITVYDDYEEGIVTHDTEARARADFQAQIKEYKLVYLCKILERS